MKVLNPFWELTEKVAINITDRDYYDIVRDWELTPDICQEEFGWDGCVFFPDDNIPRKSVDMTFDEYVALVQMYALVENEMPGATRLL